MAAAAVAQGAITPRQQQDILQATRNLLDTLGPELRAKAMFPLDGRERLDWHYIPRERVGVSLKEMDLPQRRAAHSLLRTALSARGYLKATAVMSLEEVLRAVEKDRSDVEQIRDQEKYWFAVFGEPGENQPWGWRIEGHHLSLNFCSAKGSIVATAPMFYGANPAEVRIGPRAGLRVLAAEEDLARQLMASLNETQAKRALIAADAPQDIITAPGKSIDLGQPAGLSASDMDDAQRALLQRLIAEYAHNLRGDLARSELRAIRRSGIEKVHFAWAGSLERGKGHYYRIHGPTFIIEYDNTQNDANHIHTVWHSTTNDFGLDALKKHYSEHPHGTAR
jgi:hypothetical protein